ncbi:MAG: hypothetical protein QXU87_08795 [Candidatus Caldarchaeum sp.]
MLTKPWEEWTLSNALVSAAQKVYVKLPEMLGLDSTLPPEEVVSRLKRFFEDAEDPLASHILLSRIVNLSLKMLGEDWQVRLLKLMEEVNTCQASQP